MTLSKHDREALARKVLLPLQQFLAREKNTPDEVYLRQPSGGAWRCLTWKQAGQEVRSIAAALKALNLPPGSSIALVSKNCAHWAMADLAIWMAGHVAVPLYANLTANGFRPILAHSETKAAFIGKLDSYEPIEGALSPAIPAIYFPYKKSSRQANWDDLVRTTPPLAQAPDLAPTDIATIIYTSGTTGEPKGAVHDFASLAISGHSLVTTYGFRPGDRFFAYLTFAHVAEKLISEISPLYCGGSISFVESINTFTDNLRATQPHIFLAVPRIWTKFQEGVLAKMPQHRLTKILSIPLLGGFVRRKIRFALGLGKMHTGVTGAAPTPDALLQWYAHLGIHIQEAYGLTENFAYSHGNRRESIKVGTVGPPQLHVEAKTVASGEVWVASPCNMRGYFKDPEQTRLAFEGDFLKTGDLGQIDGEGYLKITGRLKDLFKTAKGKYIAPVPLELKVARLNYVAQVCVVGTGLPQPMALVVLSDEARKVERATVTRAFEGLLQEINATVERHEQLAKIVVLGEPWTVENEMLTPTLKVKRSVVEKRYTPHFAEWQKKTEPVVYDEGSVD